MTTAKSSPKEVALEFVRAINRHDLDAILGLMSDDHVFVNSLGMKVEGKETLRKAWTGYLKMVPDFAIEIEESFEDGSKVALTGTTRGSYAKDGKIVDGSGWSTPAAWRVVVRENLVAVWQVYADNEPLRQVMAKQG